jgi:hypothetical protein
MENLFVKAGWLLVEYIDFPSSAVFNDKLILSQGMDAGKIISGANEIGMTIFFKDSVCFDQDGTYLLVKMDDVLAWIKPEVKEDDKKEGNSEGSESSTVA